MRIVCFCIFGQGGKGCAVLPAFPCMPQSRAGCLSYSLQGHSCCMYWAQRNRVTLQFHCGVAAFGCVLTERSHTVWHRVCTSSECVSQRTVRCELHVVIARLLGRTWEEQDAQGILALSSAHHPPFVPAAGCTCLCVVHMRSSLPRLEVCIAHGVCAAGSLHITPLVNNFSSSGDWRTLCMHAVLFLSVGTYINACETRLRRFYCGGGNAPGSDLVIYTRRCTLLRKLRTNTLTTRPCMYCRAFTLRGPVCMCCSRPYSLHVVQRAWLSVCQQHCMLSQEGCFCLVPSLNSLPFFCLPVCLYFISSSQAERLAGWWVAPV